MTHLSFVDHAAFSDADDFAVNGFGEFMVGGTRVGNSFDGFERRQDCEPIAVFKVDVLLVMGDAHEMRSNYLR